MTVFYEGDPLREKFHGTDQINSFAFHNQWIKLRINLDLEDRASKNVLADLKLSLQRGQQTQ